jgi:hypothetical protein
MAIASSFFFAALNGARFRSPQAVPVRGAKDLISIAPRFGSCLIPEAGSDSVRNLLSAIT